jgi:ABC-type lipoprotein export system ATPase subunit
MSKSKTKFLLEIKDLKKSYLAPDGDERKVVDLARLTMLAGEQWALEGSSGSGKTTLLNLLSGILRPDSGSIKLESMDFGELDEAGRDKLRAEKIGYIFQTFNLLQGYTALENVLMAMSFAGSLDLSKAKELLKRVGLEQRMHDRPNQLSTGQQQRVAVARALSKRPSLVLADEPTGNLDRSNAKQVLGLIREICSELGAGLLLVSHDPQVTRKFSRRLRLKTIPAMGAKQHD